MAVGVTLFVIGILIVVIWVFIEVQRFRHKLFAFFLIGLILFTYFSFTTVAKDKDLDFKSIEGITEASKIYFAWLGSAFGNIKSITSHATGLDWKGDDTNSTKKS